MLSLFSFFVSFVLYTYPDIYCLGPRNQWYISLVGGRGSQYFSTIPKFILFVSRLARVPWEVIHIALTAYHATATLCTTNWQLHKLKTKERKVIQKCNWQQGNIEGIFSPFAKQMSFPLPLHLFLKLRVWVAFVCWTPRWRIFLLTSSFAPFRR